MDDSEDYVFWCAMKHNLWLICLLLFETTNFHHFINNIYQVLKLHPLQQGWTNAEAKLNGPFLVVAGISPTPSFVDSF